MQIRRTGRSQTGRLSGQAPASRARVARHPEEPLIAGEQRLQKVLAATGLGSRRNCEELIRQGRIEIDRTVVTELGTKVDPTAHEIRVDGEVLSASRPVYYLVNKPRGVVTTNFDPSGRPRVVDLVPAGRERLFAVGRLDLFSEGLILVTNDGALANRLTHPRYGVEKTYHALVAGNPTNEILEQLRQGVRLAEGLVHVVSARTLRQSKQSAHLEIVLSEGRNREIRRLLAKIGHKVLELRRVAIGPLRLKGLASGEFRPLRDDELHELRHASGMKREPRRRITAATVGLSQLRRATATKAKAPASRTPARGAGRRSGRKRATSESR